MSEERGYKLVDKLETEANDIADDRRRQLVLAAATEIIALIHELTKAYGRIYALEQQLRGRGVTEPPG